MSDGPEDEQIRAVVEAVEANARMAYAAYRTQRNVVEGDHLPPYDALCERKKERFRAIARANMTYTALRLTTSS